MQEQQEQEQEQEQEQQKKRQKNEINIAEYTIMNEQEQQLDFCCTSFLSEDDRYDVWAVKKEERPQLLLLDFDNNNNNTNNDNNENQSTLEEQEEQEEEQQQGQQEEEQEQKEELPLIDGCDIPGWRHSKLIDCSNYIIQGYLNIGSGCTLLRRETQLPILSTKSYKQWYVLREQLLQVRTNTKIQRLTKNDPTIYTINPWFEKQNIPILLEPCCISTWKALNTCTWNNLLKRYGNYYWRFSDTHGETMTLITYNKYVTSLEGQLDDSPLAVYDSQFGNNNNNEQEHYNDNNSIDHNNDDDDDEEKKDNNNDTSLRSSILNEYNIPTCFNAPDLFECLDTITENNNNNNNDISDDDDDDDTTTTTTTTTNSSNNTIQRPPYRWILMGPARSGTGLHIDPMGTHAWVTLIEGIKRWVLFPYGTDPKLIKMEFPQIPSVIWFDKYYDDIIAKYKNTAIEIIQKRGETVYVPAGWPHLVLNLTNTVAITHNYATEYPSFERLVSCVKKEEPNLLPIWLKQLQYQRPDLVSSIV